METAWLTRGTEYPFRCFDVWLISTTMCWWRRPLKIPNNAYYVQSLTGGFDRARRGKWMMHSKLEVWEKKTELPEAIQRWMHQLCNYCTCSICFQNFPLCLHLSFAIYSLFLSQDWPGDNSEYISHQDCPPQLLCTSSLGVLEHFFQQRVQRL